MTESNDDFNELFIGGTPPFLMLDYQLQSLFSVVELARAEADKAPRLYVDTMQRAAEVALVGAVGFFEAFCKHQFAALLSIHPALLSNFAARRPQATIALSALSETESPLGFAIADQYDFGSAKLINGLFRDLVTATPFDRDEAARFDEILRKRHIIVHHGGIHTPGLSGSVQDQSDAESRPYRAPLSLNADQYYEICEFITLQGVKVTTSTVGGLRRLTNDLQQVDLVRRGAVQLLLRAVWDELDG